MSHPEIKLNSNFSGTNTEAEFNTMPAPRAQLLEDTLITRLYNKSHQNLCRHIRFQAGQHLIIKKHIKQSAGGTCLGFASALWA